MLAGRPNPAIHWFRYRGGELRWDRSLWAAGHKGGALPTRPDAQKDIARTGEREVVDHCGTKVITPKGDGCVHVGCPEVRMMQADHLKSPKKSGFFHTNRRVRYL